MDMELSNLDLVRAADAFPWEDKDPAAFKAVAETIYTLLWPGPDGDHPIGHMLDYVVDRLLAVPQEVRGSISVDRELRTVRAFDYPTEAERTRVVGALLAYWRERQTFAILRGWRDELWPVYATNDQLVFSIERAAAGLLGVMHYGVHMTAYVKDGGVDHGIRIWVPQRAPNKSTFPGMLDNSAAGGLVTNEDPFEAMVREAEEEGSLAGPLMRERLTQTGQVSYIYITGAGAGGERGLIYPETQWVYDIELPPDVALVPNDGEVAQFHLWTVAETQAALSQGRFKPNCALILLDFFVRHRILTPDNEPDYDEIVQRMHRKLVFPGPHQLAET